MNASVTHLHAVCHATKVLHKAGLLAHHHVLQLVQAINSLEEDLDSSVVFTATRALLRFGSGFASEESLQTAVFLMRRVEHSWPEHVRLNAVAAVAAHWNGATNRNSFLKKEVCALLQRPEQSVHWHVYRLLLKAVLHGVPVNHAVDLNSVYASMDLYQHDSALQSIACRLLSLHSDVSLISTVPRVCRAMYFNAACLKVQYRGCQALLRVLRVKNFRMLTQPAVQAVTCCITYARTVYHHCNLVVKTADQILGVLVETSVETTAEKEKTQSSTVSLCV